MANIRLFVKGFKGGSLPVFIQENATVDNLFEEIGKVTKMDPYSFRILYERNSIDKKNDGNKQLPQYGIKDNSNLFMVAGLKGGMFRPLPLGVSLTEEADIITFDDDPTIPRFKMPCGHAIAAETLKEYCKSELNQGKFEFRCPQCRKEWQSSLIRALADLSVKENQEFDTFITQNFLYKGHGVQTCPKCGTYCERMDSKCPRVQCPACSSNGTNFYFCWYCLGKWTSPWTKNCGSKSCTGEDPCLTVLRNCPNTKIEYNNVICPSIRACPSCRFLIEHAGGCKKFCCLGCKQGFCFICLSKTNSDGKLPCGNHMHSCVVAPLQTHLYD